MVLAIIFILIFLCFLFLSDKKEAINRNNKLGLKNIFPNFVAFVNRTYSDKMEFVKDDARYLEYRFPILGNYRQVIGYYHIGLDSLFGTNVYVWAISKSGYKHKGFLREIHNGRSDKRADLTVEEYSLIFDQLLQRMEESPEYFKLNF